MDIRKILCVDGENICHSVIMEALFKRAIQEAEAKRRSPEYDLSTSKVIGITVESTRTYHPKSTTVSVGAGAIAYMKELGIDISGHTVRSVSQINIDDFDLIICFSPRDVKAISEYLPRGLVLLADKGGLSDHVFDQQQFQNLVEGISNFVDSAIKTLFA